MLKVLKFGGSSLADAQQFAKVKAIVEADESRRVVIVSAPGKRFSGDHKITDLLYLCAAHIKYGVSCEEIFDMIRTRYLEIAHDCGLKLDLNPDFDALWAKMQEGIEKDELASRGEYFSARLMAEYLGYEFLDAAEWVKFRFDGTVDTDATYEALRRAAGDRSVVIPGFYGVMPDGRIRTFSRQFHHPVFCFPHEALHIANQLQQREKMVVDAVGIIGKKFLQPDTKSLNLTTIGFGTVSINNR